MRSNITLAYRKVFPKDAVMTNTSDALKKVYDFWDSIKELESIAVGDERKLVERGFMSVMILRAIFTEDKCVKIIGDHSHLIADFMNGLNVEVQEEDLALFTVICLTVPCQGLQNEGRIRMKHCRLMECLKAHFVIRWKEKAEQVLTLLLNKFIIEELVTEGEKRKKDGFCELIDKFNIPEEQLKSFSASLTAFLIASLDYHIAAIENMHKLFAYYSIVGHEVSGKFFFPDCGSIRKSRRTVKLVEAFACLNARVKRRLYVMLSRKKFR
ncbi:unnamed protein product [Gongylonema pulchrum]|uniref:NR LBD domain-containing protein n=1 Tax=Gongylonema pulchrum TaxID=637853 RepID=A0A183E929_9BILA|nr:unnamed protein product [Gongylonema pulchrum]